MTLFRIAPVPLERDAYAPYGDVVAAAGCGGRPANQGRARVWDRLAPLVDRRPGRAAANVAVFRSDPWAAPVVPVRFLERHPHSTQLFAPMAATRYLVVVALGADVPDSRTLAAFIARADQAITYHPGTWHHPLLALDRVTDFVGLSFEDGTAEDCHLLEFEPPLAEVVVPV